MSILRIVTCLLSAAMLCLLTPNSALASPNPKITSLVDGVDRGEGGPQLDIRQFTINIDQHGTTATFELTIEIANPSNRQVEGRFTLQLPREAVLTGYALDIEGRMVPGSLIDQPKARQVYEDEVRGNIDPGLAEITTGNLFSTRIYPIASEGSRTISLSFVTPIDMVNGLTLPLETAGAVGSFTLNAQFRGLKEAPKLMLDGDSPIALERKGRSWVANDIAIANEPLSGSLVIAPTAPRSKAQATRHSNGDRFFALDDRVEAKALASEDVARIRIYWDRSRSRAEAMFTEERQLIGRVVGELVPQAVDLVRFASDAADHRSFSDWNALDASLADTQYRGATSFAGLDQRDLEEADLCIVFSDGGVTLDRQANFAPDCPLMIVASGPNVDASGLNRIARDGNGSVLYLAADNLAAVAEQMQRLPLSVVSIRDVNGRRVPFRNVPASPGQLKVVGKLPNWDEITVRLSGVARRDRKQVYLLNMQTPERHNAAGALWAQQEVAKLSDDPSDRDAMRKMALRFQVASPTMAFLVLENPGQYINAELTPPDAFSEGWMAEYAEAKAEADEEMREQREDHFAEVLEQWEDTKAWWERDIDGDAVMRKQDGFQAGLSASGAPAPASAPPPTGGTVVAIQAPQEVYGDAADQSAPEQEEAQSERNDIVVTGARVSQNSYDSPLSVTAISAEELIGNEVGITLEDVLSDQPYLAALDKAKPGERLSVLAEQEKSFGALPAFYLDVSEWFRLRGDSALARELLLSALDLPTTDDETRLIVAFRLQRDGEHDAAIALYEVLAATTDYRPQPKRALALALASRAQVTSGAAKRDDLERAFALLSEAVLDPFDDRYRGIDMVGLMELNSLIPQMDQIGATWTLDERLVAKLDTDVRIVIEWTNADEDLDLWVTEPTKERASYSNKQTDIGGRVSDDMTSGYGPEEYWLRRSAKGEYVVKVQGFSGDRINPNGPGRVMVRLIRNFARATQEAQLIDAEISFDRSESDANDRAVATLTVE